MWVATTVLVGITYFSYRSQMDQKGYAHLPVLWLLLLVVLVLVAIGITVQWLFHQGRALRNTKIK
jgi:hypothetical protein